jgi:hypothetical protein
VRGLVGVVETLVCSEGKLCSVVIPYSKTNGCTFMVTGRQERLLPGDASDIGVHL